MMKKLASTDALALEAIANDIKGAVNAVFAICIAMECGCNDAKSYTDGLYFVHDALREQTEKLCEVIDMDNDKQIRGGNSMIDIEKVAALYDARLDRWIAGEQQDKRGILGQLVLLRFMIRKNLQVASAARENLRYYERQKNILKKLGAEVPFLEAEILRYKAVVKVFRSTLRKFGESLFTLLDAWQEAGANRDDLYNLCSAHRLEAWAKQMLAEETEQTFSGLLFVHNLDYAPDGTGWIDDKADAPFTHAAKEYMLDIMLHTAKGREASHNALMEVFPGMMENAMTMRVDEFGQECLYDHEGNLIGPVTPE